MMTRLTTFGVGVAACAVLVACDSSTEPPPPPPPTVWAAALAGEGGAALSGEVSVESSASSFAAAIDIVEGEAGATYGWYIGEGPECNGEEARVGEAEDYPALEPNGDGEASAEAEVGVGLDPDEEYHVAVVSEDGATTIACGALELDEQED